MVKSKINQILDARPGKVIVSLSLDKSFLKNCSNILTDLGMDIQAKQFAEKKKDLKTGLINYDDIKKYDIDIIFFPEHITLMVRVVGPDWLERIEKFKKVLLKYAEYK